jgi:phosphopantetheinyl transferase
MQELERMREFQLEKRRIEWLAGRIAAKTAVRLLPNMKSLTPRQIQILNEADGHPNVLCPAGFDPPLVSLAHDSEGAVAVASLGGSVTVDVEEIQGSVVDIRHDFSEDDEVERVSQCLDGNIYKILTHIWTVKECVRKLAGPHRVPVQSVRIEQVESLADYLLYKVSCGQASSCDVVSYSSGKRVFAFAKGREAEDGS